MKIAPILRRAAALCAALALSASALSAADARRVDALHVAKVATDYLATLGKNAPQIVSIALESDALVGGKTSWIVRFSHSILVDGNKEIGMRVKLDGSVSHLTESKTGPKPRNVPLKS